MPTYRKKKILLSDFKKLNKSKRKEYNPIIQTADIKRYCIVWQKEYILTEIYSQNIQKDFKKPKIVIARMTKNIQASFDKNKFYIPVPDHLFLHGNIPAADSGAFLFLQNQHWNL